MRLRFSRQWPVLLCGLAVAVQAAAAAASVDGLRAPQAVERLRELSGGQDPWFVDGSVPRPAVGVLMRWLATASDHGLQADDYHLERLHGLFDALADDASAERIDRLSALLSDAALVFASHLGYGKLDRTTLQPVWHADTRGERDLVLLLHSALARNELGQMYSRLAPSDPRYRHLQKALAQVRQAPARPYSERVPAGRTLRPGQSDPRVPILRRRLGLSGESETYDLALQRAVRQFQVANGLEPDALVGTATLRVMNRGPADIRDMLLASLERWRWLPEALGDRRIEVNVPSFELAAYAGRQPTLEMKVVAGQEQRSTPVFSGLMTQVVLHPYWEVPYKLAVRDLLPRFQRQPTLVQSLGFDVLRWEGGREVPVPASSVDWNVLSKDYFPYRLRQRPGPQNALGQIKFLFPNRYAVYLHDTSQTELFDHTVRTFSSGCIRVEQPRALFEWLSLGQEAWPRQPSETPRVIELERPVPVHILYWTAVADAAGEVSYWPDVYLRDPAVVRGVRTRPPKSEQVLANGS